MPTIDWPDALVPQTSQPMLRKSGVQFGSPFNGTTQAVDFLAERWVLSASLAEMQAHRGAQASSFLNFLAGGVNRVRVWPFHTKGAPRGTLRGAPVLALAAARGDTAVQLTTVPFVTLLQGDHIRLVNGQLLQVAADTMANAGGAMDVSTVNRVRGTVAIATAVTWSRPTCEMIMPAMQAGLVWRPGAVESAALDLIEVW